MLEMSSRWRASSHAIPSATKSASGKVATAVNVPTGAWFARSFAIVAAPAGARLTITSCVSASTS
jgi:uncharacterized protein YraI